MTPSIRFCLVLHNHQPVGNFDGVIEQAYFDSYGPFLDELERQPHLPISLHVSGPLMEWLDEHRPDYLDRLAALVADGRLEIVGGAFYEPILTMIPSRDRVGQITQYTRWLENRLGAHVQGAWVPERVWEPTLTTDLVEAGIRYTVLDDFHFKNAGLTDDALRGYYLTEDDGRLLSVFPGSERLRYLIPFGGPEQTIELLRGVAERHPGAVVVFGDDGEKFGSWPETNRHVYEDGWLREFFAALASNGDWIQVTTLAEAHQNTPPVGKVYLPDSSYREMTEWVLPVERQNELATLAHEMENDPRWARIRSFIRGGFWRNFRVKYPEADEMYSRMMQVSHRLYQTRASDTNREELANARRELYRGQCNCPYWHGAFGGIYLPHLRNAVYNHLIAADNLLDQAQGRTGPWVEALADDYNYDGRQEVRLSNDKLVCLVAPAGGHLYELDVRSICLNLLATLARRPEAYHERVRSGAQQGDNQVASIHDRVVFKQPGLEQRLQYDWYLRKSLIDHFHDSDVSLEAIRGGTAAERGDFVGALYETRIRRSPSRVQVLLMRSGHVGELPVTVTKGVTLEAGRGELEIAYLLEGLPSDRELHFSVELNLAGLPAGADDRYFSSQSEGRRGHLGTLLDLHGASDLSLTDEWQGIDVRLSSRSPVNLWTYPIESVSQSEGGFELVHQSVVVQPHWLVRGDNEGRWSTTLSLSIDTARAEGRMEHSAEAAAS